MNLNTKDNFSPWRFARRFFLAFILFILFVFFLIWRTDNPRVEQFRFMVMENYMPDLDVFFHPLTLFSDIANNLQSYQSLIRENQELRQEVQQMEQLREAALQLEQINAELRALNNLSVSPSLSYVAGEVIADSGSSFSQTLLMNIGRNRKVYPNAPVVDGFGLIGRVIGVGNDKSRVLMINDPTSQIAAQVMPARIPVIVRGNNSGQLDLIVMESGSRLAAGSRVVTADNGTLPPDLLLGYINIGINNEASVRIAADFSALSLARVLMPPEPVSIDENGLLVVPKNFQRQEIAPEEPSNSEASNS